MIAPADIYKPPPFDLISFLISRTSFRSTLRSEDSKLVLSIPLISSKRFSKGFISAGISVFGLSIGAGFFQMP